MNVRRSLKNHNRLLRAEIHPLRKRTNPRPRGITKAQGNLQETYVRDDEDKMEKLYEAE